MATVTFAEIGNKGLTLLNGDITDAATVINVDSAADLTLDDSTTFAYLMLVQVAEWRKDPITTPEIYEIVKVTAISTNALTIVRAQDGTSALAFSDGDVVELRMVQAHLVDIHNALTDGTDDLNIGALTAGGVIRADNGTSTVPSITFAGSLTSGFACNGDALEFITAGTNRGSVNSGGKFDWEGAMDVLGTLTTQNKLDAYGQARYAVQQSIGTTGSVSWDIDEYPSGKTVLTGNLTITAINNIVINANAVLYVQQNASAKTITWPSSVKWVGGSAPDLTTNSAKYLISFFSYVAGSVVGTVISDFS